MIVLQGLHGLSDRETAEPVTSDLRLNAGCGLAINAAGFHPSLTYWRRRLTANDRPQRIVEAPPWGDHGNCWPGSSDGRWIPRPWMMLLPGRTVGSVDRFGPRDRLSWMSCGRPVHHSRCHGQDQNMINFTLEHRKRAHSTAVGGGVPPAAHRTPEPETPLFSTVLRPHRGRTHDSPESRPSALHKCDGDSVRLPAMQWIRRRWSGGSAKPEFNEIVIIAAPRSGTNFFCECLGALPEVAGFYELFNREGAFGIGGRILPVLCDRFGLTGIESAKDPRLVKVFRETPLEALDALASVAREHGKSAMSYKIFPRQLSMDTVGQILDDDRRHPLFLVRRRLDVYISLEKARHSGSWTRSSTVDVRPEVQVEDFLRWAAKTDKWYAETFKASRERAKRIIVANYESDVDVPKRELIGRIHRALGTFGISTTLPGGLKIVRFRRQDRRGHPFEKIANGEALRASLKEAGKLRYALGTPLQEEQLAFPFVRD